MTGTLYSVYLSYLFKFGQPFLICRNKAVDLLDSYLFKFGQPFLICRNKAVDLLDSYLFKFGQPFLICRNKAVDLLDSYTCSTVILYLLSCVAVWPNSQGVSES